ncbi:GNAT family N-acetyltransferase [Halorubrum sp. JWXQ-INN 858]|uniref:GNAT family N-acetyltransferase n=1 Tax=Halorubrum sp. JWXQ-INN 858 TaxID=2690782 RepID=UPI00135C058B|nr:GNAT family N-acetyltransferase [Halorubrum sp. JWXQ-INN 858]MWV65413.1 GNAT family N-acetyltransferase [Halorubrum sp. JWXQ-INN 858]
MDISIEEASEGELWNDLLAESSRGSPFHRYEFLTTCAEYAGAVCRPYIGYKGNEPVGLFPVFEVQKGPFSVAFSPPPELKVHYLGPVLLNLGELKSRKREQRNRRFIEAVLDEVEREFDPRYVHVRTTPAHHDERPFLWAGYDGTSRHTYVIDLTADREDLLAGFSSDLRKHVRDHAGALDVSRATGPEVERIIEEVAALHERKDVDYTVPPPFVRDVHQRLPDGMVHAHLCRYEGEFCGGEVALEHDGVVYGWQSVADTDLPVPVYDLLYWNAIESARDRGCTGYDLLGANNPDLCRYKSKFAPDLRRYHSLSRGGWEMKLAAKVYKTFR